MGLARVAYDLPMAASPACVQKSSHRKVRGPTEKCAIYVTQALTLLTERLGWILSRVLKNTNSVGLCHPRYSNTFEGRCVSRTFPVRLSCNPRQNQKAWQKPWGGGGVGWKIWTSWTRVGPQGKSAYFFLSALRAGFWEEFLGQIVFPPKLTSFSQEIFIFKGLFFKIFGASRQSNRKFSWTDWRTWAGLGGQINPTRGLAVAVLPQICFVAYI